MIGRRRRRRMRWAWLLDSPLVLATWITVVLGAWSLDRVGDSLANAARSQVAVDAELARLAADTALMQVEPRALMDGMQRYDLGDLQVDVVPEFGSGAVGLGAQDGEARLRVDVQVASGREFSFCAPLLSGAAPRGFGCARSGQLPKLAAGALERAVHAEDLVAFRRDETIALMHLQGGTDLVDFVLESAQLDCPGDVIAVPGHLWIEPGERPVVVRLERDTTIVVRGNCYLGRSLLVMGTGRLVVAILGEAGGTPLARGAAAPLEGVGRLRIGLGVGEALRCDASLAVAAGVELERPAIVAGAFLAASPSPRRPDPALPGRTHELRLTGERLFETARERVPGFAVSGPPRPGLLEITPPRGPRPAPDNSPELALYGTPLGR